MATIEIKDLGGKSVGTANLEEAVFAIEPNQFAVHQVVRSQQAALRAGTHSTKTRSMVQGGGKKPWRQKGTGRARQGTIRAPQWAGGGVVFGPHPRSYAFKVPKKVIKLAMRSVLTDKLNNGQLHVVDSFTFEKPSTKDAKAILAALGIQGLRTTVVVGNEDENAYLSFRNLDRVQVIAASEANTYDLINNKAVVFTAETLQWVGEVLK